MRKLSSIAILTTALITLSMALSAQSTLSTLRDHQTAQVEKIVKLSSALSKSRKGHTLYLNPNWQNSAIETLDGKIYYFNGRYSVLDNSIEARTSSGIRVILPSRVKSAMIGHRYFASIGSDQIDEKSNPVYLEILTSGKANLFYKHILKSRMRGSNSLTAGLNGEKEYYKDKELYYSVNQNLIKKVKSKKKMLKDFGLDKDILERFAKDQKLKFNSKEDLMKIFEYYDEQATN